MDHTNEHLPISEPTPIQKSLWSPVWLMALNESTLRAKAFFTVDHHARIDRAIRIILDNRILVLQNRDAVVESDDSTDKETKVYKVTHGHCECLDAEQRSPWCKHNLARALILRAREVFAEYCAVKA